MPEKGIIVKSVHGISKKPETVLKLVRKRYLEEALEAIDRDIELLDAVLADYVSFDEASIMEDFIEQYPGLEEGAFCKNDRMTEWAASRKTIEKFYEDDLKSVSGEGILMRSKGELLIASRLDHFGLPYRYEEPLELPGITLVPDFKIKRPRDYKLIYWEHLGMVNDEGYMKHNQQKMRIYADYGIVPWDNLIISYDRWDGGIDTKIIDALIKGWLL